MTSNAIFTAFLSNPADDAPFLNTPDGETLTYTDLRARVLSTNARLQSAGVVPGDRVLCQIEKSPDGLILYLATVAAGAVFIPLNTAYTPAELAYFLQDADPALLILDDSTSAARATAEQAGVPTATPADLTQPGPPADPVPRAPDDLAAILYTSGTTGRSKGAMLTHDNLISNATALAETWHWTAQDRLLHALPIFHTHGLFVATNVTLISGACMVFLPAFSLDQIARHLPDCTTIMGVPTFYSRMLGDPRFDTAAMAHLRLVISGSAPLLADTHAAFATQTGHRVLERYGMTETNMITSNPYDGPRRAGTVGHPLPEVSLRIADPDEKGIGGIEVKGPNVTPGYWRNPDKTAESFTSDGWFITGDLAMTDGDGYVSIVGRQKDLVISGGYNIYPKEVEVEIDALPGVTESAVFGIPHPDLGEAVAAAVVLDDAGATDPDTILAALSERLARFKIPRRIDIVAALPRNAMGKVQKNQLRDAASERARTIKQGGHRMAGPMTWDEYGKICRDNGQLALQVFACVTTPHEPGPPPPDVLSEHKAYIAGLEVSGQVFLAGPLSTPEGTHMSGAGMIIFAAPDIAAARALADADPMHKAGVRSFTLQAWRLNEGAPIPGLRLSQRGFDIPG